MKSKILNFLLILSSLIGYLEWSGNNHSFLFQAEAEIFSKIISNPASVFHPLTILPMMGQLILVFTLFQKTPNKILTYISIGGLGLLLLLILLIGLMNLNFKMILSTLPFIVISVLTILHHRKHEA
ncbi:MAG: hypothetical protein IPM92_12205 [Saprospiraceae bacterium]|nr:hypothetical protein [Saprospiraceae bacterium]